MNRIWFVVLIGALGCATLISLGVWQMKRLDWKLNIISQIDEKQQAAPVDLPSDLDPERDQYLAVKASGKVIGPEIHLLVTVPPEGAGFRVITPFEVGGRKLLLDHGYINETSKAKERSYGPLSVVGNLHWPDDRGFDTPDPNFERNIWFSRNVEQMAQFFKTEPVLLVIKEISEGEAIARPLPVTVNIRNEHLQYAITWFSLAIVWTLMTGYWIWRSRAPKKSES